VISVVETLERILSKGIKNGKSGSYAYFLAPETSRGAMSLTTVSLCAARVLMIGREEFKENWVFSPEALNPDRFLPLPDKLGRKSR